MVCQYTIYILLSISQETIII